MSTVLRRALSLNVADRLQLIEELWDSLVVTLEAIPVTDAQRKELARRRRAYARSPSAAKCWEEVRAELEGRLRYEWRSGSQKVGDAREMHS
jgi:putative addiction module component (TIGR02574 family)